MTLPYGLPCRTMLLIVLFFISHLMPSQCQNSDAIGDYEYYYYYEDELLPTTGIVIDRFQKPKLVDRSIAYAGIGATAIGTSGNRAGPAPVISEKSDKNSDKSLVTSDTTATGDNSSPDYDIQELLEAWKEYIREKEIKDEELRQQQTVNLVTDWLPKSQDMKVIYKNRPQSQRPQSNARPDSIDIDKPITGNRRPAQRPRRPPPEFDDYEDTPRRPAQRPNRPAFSDYDDFERPSQNTGFRRPAPQKSSRPRRPPVFDYEDTFEISTGSRRRPSSKRPSRPVFDYEDIDRPQVTGQAVRLHQRPSRPIFDYEDTDRPASQASSRPRPAKRPSRPVFDYEDSTGFGRGPPQRPSRPFQFDYEEYNEYECEPRAESYREPDATQCDKYFECNIKGEQSEHLCVDGYVYDEKSQNCDYPSKVDCGQRTELQPPQPSKNCPRANGFFAWPAEESCQKFWDCRGGQSYLQTCPQGVIFDMFVDACVTPDQSRRKECSAGEFLNFTCPTYSADEPLRFGNHDRLSDPDDCTKFYSCLRDSRPRLGVCPRKTVFNNATGVCDDPKAVPGCENFWKDKEEEEFLDYYDYS